MLRNSENNQQKHMVSCEVILSGQDNAAIDSSLPSPGDQDAAARDSTVPDLLGAATYHPDRAQGKSWLI